MSTCLGFHRKPKNGGSNYKKEQVMAAIYGSEMIAQLVF
jgi:hypothetical protein